VLFDPALRQQQSPHSMKLFYTLTSLLIPTTTQCIVRRQGRLFAIYLPRHADPTRDQLSSTGRICNPLKQRLLTCTAVRHTWVLKAFSWTHTKTAEADELLKRKMQRNYETELTCILIIQ